MNKVHSGRLIVIEGLDKSGKTTQSNLLFDYLNKKYSDNVVLLSFPDYSTKIGIEIKDFLEGKRTYNNETKHILLSANRWEKKEVIEDHLRSGKIVIMNRYYQSNIAYGLANGLEKDWLVNLDNGLPKEDITIILDIVPDVSIKRVTNNNFIPDDFERNREFLMRARDEYIKLAKIYQWKIVCADVPMISIFNSILKILGE